MSGRESLHDDLRQRILGLSGVSERRSAGIHEDAFYVGGKMFVHIHGTGHCDIRLSRDTQARVLADGKALPHRWAPKSGYVTFLVRKKEDIEPAMDLIKSSHGFFSRNGSKAA